MEIKLYQNLISSIKKCSIFLLLHILSFINQKTNKKTNKKYCVQFHLNAGQ